MNLTTLLGLGKPTGGEDYNIDVPNNNMDKIDAAIKADRERLTTVEGAKKYAVKVLAPDAANTDANGYATYTHGLSWTPGAVVAVSSQPDNKFGQVWGIDTITATKFRVRFGHAANDVLYATLPAPSVYVFFGEV